MEALGTIETVGLAAAFEAADVACKTANVELIGYELAKGGGFVTIKVVGKVAAVNSAIDAAIWATWASECVRELRAYGTSLAVGHCSILSASQEMVMPHLPDAHGTLHQRSVPSLPA